MKEIVHDPEAKRDIVGAARFYEARVKGLGARFLKALDVTILKIASNPQMYVFCEKPIRSCRVNGFPYRVFFADEPEFVCGGFTSGASDWLVALSPGRVKI